MTLKGHVPQWRRPFWWFHIKVYINLNELAKYKNCNSSSVLSIGVSFLLVAHFIKFWKYLTFMTLKAHVPHWRRPFWWFHIKVQVYIINLAKFKNCNSSTLLSMGVYFLLVTHFIELWKHLTFMTFKGHVPHWRRPFWLLNIQL